jgi:hypothetical protein
MSEPKLEGGTAADRAELLRLHHAYIDANTDFDRDKLQSIFSARDDAEFFNLNGFTYGGLDHWNQLWRYYATQVQSTFWTPYDIKGIVDTDTAVLWCHRRCRRIWVGTDQPVKDIVYDNTEFMSRSTMIFRREAAGWRVVHVHFSRGEEGPRPGGI